MEEKAEAFARHLGRALYLSTDGEPRLWVVTAKLNDVKKEVAVQTGPELYLPGMGGPPLGGSLVCVFPCASWAPAGEEVAVARAWTPA